jgi:cytochrome c
MRLLSTLIGAHLLLAIPAHADDLTPALGQPLTNEAAATVSFNVFPDGRGLPPGSGTAATGEEDYLTFCAACHGADGKTETMVPISGGIGSLNSDTPLRTVGSYWAYATTLFEYTRRTMPYDAPSSLTDDQYYAITAYVLRLNEITSMDDVIDATTLPLIQMPNAHGYTSLDKAPGQDSLSP